MPVWSEFESFDRNPDPALDELTELASILSGADYAYMGWMDFSRLWFKARHGFEAVEQARTATACQWMLKTASSLLIRDAGHDPRFPPDGIPLAGGKNCLSYAGTPLISSDRRILGSFAILAREPDRFSQEHLALLEILARQAVTRLELYMRIQAQEQAQRSLQRTERALGTERGFVSATMDSIPALVAVLDTAGRVVRLNHLCAQLTGLSTLGAVGRPFFEEVLTPSDGAWAADRLRDAANGEFSGPHENPWRVAASTGGNPAFADATALASPVPPRLIRWTLRPLKGTDGEIQFLILSGQDVTEQRQAERALLSSESRYRQIVESSLGFVFTCTMDGLLTSLNAYTAETLGYRAEDLIGRSVADLLSPTGAAAFRESLRSLQTEQEWHGAVPVRRSDGVYRRIAFRSRRMALPGEQPFILNHGMDVTEQHDAEEALYLSTRQRELILESVGDGILGIALDGSLTFINQAAARALGYGSEHLIGRSLHEILSPSQSENQAENKSAILQAMRRREPVRRTDELFRRQDGVAIPVEYTATPLIENGDLAGMVVAFQDASERRRLEKMKDEFISTVSHELRTPLTSLRAALGLIASGALEKRPEKRAHMMELAIGNCDRLVRLVNGILDFDSVEKGLLPLHCETVEPIDLLRRAADTAHAAASQAHIGFRIDAPSAPVLADEERILQVLNELVSNALKFSPAETQIHLSARPLGVSATGVHEVCLVVEDQGCGISAEKMERIFDRFQQGDASDSRALGGTGLGLALCRSIVEQHGGRIWAENLPGQGSRFLFTLPAAKTS